MATSLPGASSPRQMPVKVTSAPTSVRERVSLAASAAASNGSRCRRMVAVIAVRFLRSAARHRREEGDLARAGNGAVGAHMGAVEGGADHLRILERAGIFVAAGAQPGDEIGDGGDGGRRLDLLLRLADALAHP